MTHIADVFLKLRTAKYVVTQMCNTSRSTRPLDRQDGKRSLTLFKSARHHLNHLSFQKKDDPHSLCISEILDCKKRCYINV